MSLDFEFTPEQKMMAEIVWRWASTWLEPQMEEFYEKDRMPHKFPSGRPPVAFDFSGHVRYDPAVLIQ